MEIILGKCVNQIKEGELYEGILGLGENSFDFTLKFEGDPLLTLKEKPIPQVEISKDGQLIDLTEEENIYLVAILMEEVIELFNITADSPNFKGISIVFVGVCDFFSQAIKIFSQPKFGCIFA
jgi:hypothetical protein